MASDLDEEKILASSSPNSIFVDSEHLDIIAALLKHRNSILLLCVVVTVVVAAVVFLIPSEYTSESTVLPPVQHSSASELLSQIGGAGALASTAESSLGIKNPGDLYVSLFRARTVEDAVIQRFHLMQRYRENNGIDARKAFERHAQVSLGAKDGLITIRVTDRDKQMAAAIANGYVEEYMKFSATLAVTEASRRRQFFQQQLLEANENLVTAENALKQTEQTTGVLQIDSQTRSLIESAAEIRAQITAREVQLESMKSYETADNPEMVVVNRELDALREQLAKLAGADPSAPNNFILPKSRMPEAGLEYIRKVRDVRYYETIAELIGRQFEMAKLDEARQGSTIQIVDAAVPADKRSFPKRALSILVAFLASMLLGSGWFVFVESRLLLKNQSPT